VGCVIAAIAKANLRPEQAHVIELDASTFTFDRPDNGDEVSGFTGTPVIIANLTIRGVGASQTILERALDAPLFRLLHIGPAGRVTLEGLTIQGGAVSPVFFTRGGGVFNEGDLLVQDAVIRDNAASIGGGLHDTDEGTLRLLRSAVTDNTADFVCGGVTAGGPTFIDQSLIADNLAESGGGLCFSPLAGTVIVRRSVIAGNLAFLVSGGGVDGGGQLELRQTVLVDNASGLRGGGLNLTSGEVLMQNATCTGNQAEIFGGCAFIEAGTLTARGTLITHNSTGPFGVGGGLFNNQGGTVTLRNSVLSQNTAQKSPDCAGTIHVEGQTLVGDPTDCDVQR
jgi:hypothetical protein